jgi:hypothetical protein
MFKLLLISGEAGVGQQSTGTPRGADSTANVAAGKRRPSSELEAEQQNLSKIRAAGLEALLQEMQRYNSLHFAKLHKEMAEMGGNLGKEVSCLQVSRPQLNIPCTCLFVLHFIYTCIKIKQYV